MAKKYEEEFKLKIVGLHNNGKSVKDIIDEYGMSRSTLNNWIKKYGSNVKENKATSKNTNKLSFTELVNDKRNSLYELSIEDLEKAESALNFQFPSELRKFYLEVGYGFINGSCGNFNRLMDTDSVVSFRLKLDDYEYYETEYYDEYKEKGLIFFEVNEYNLLYIEFGDGDKNSIYNGETKIADSLYEFLEKIQEDDNYCYKYNIVDLYKNGKSKKAIIEEYEISRSDLDNWIKKYGSNVKEDKVTPSSLCPAKSEKNNMKFYKLGYALPCKTVRNKSYFLNQAYVSDCDFDVKTRVAMLALEAKSILSENIDLNLKLSTSNFKDATKVNFSFCNYNFAEYVLDDEALKFLKGIDLGDVEYIPSYCEDELLHLLYIKNTIDAVQIDKDDDYDYENDEDKIYFCDFLSGKYYIEKCNLKNYPIFRISLKYLDGSEYNPPICNQTLILVTEEFKNMVEDSGLTGLLFRELLDSKWTNC